MTEHEYNIVTADRHAGFADATFDLTRVAWPQFMFHDPVAEYFTDLYEKLPQFQFALTEKETGRWMAMGNSIPLSYNGQPSDLPDTGWDWALEKGIDDCRRGANPTVLCALQIAVSNDCRGMGLSGKALEIMRSLGRDQGFPSLFAPVRPSMKADFPHEPMEDYISRQNAEGLPFDSWMRVHARAGARIIKVCPQAMRITGTVAEWQEWTGMNFPKSGKYVIPGALVPVDFDIENDSGVYVEPNVWMHHALQ